MQNATPIAQEPPPAVTKTGRRNPDRPGFLGGYDIWLGRASG